MDKIRVRIKPRVFNAVYRKHLNNQSLVQVFFGGTGSGKSVFVAQRAVRDVMNGGRNYLICRAVAKHSRRSTFQQIQRVINEWHVSELFSINKTEMTITCSNGYQLLFTGLDDLENLKSIVPNKGVITDVWIEEATQTEQDAIRELLRRMRGGDERTPKRLTLTFNPIYKTHWIYQQYFSAIAWADDQTEYTSPELSILKTWYIHNRFLTKSDRERIEGETDEYNRNVYTLGNWGVLGDVIFKNWRVEDLSGMRDQFTNHRNGLDFGFSSDPAALFVSHFDKNHRTIYVYDELYERGYTNDVLAIEVKKLIGDQYVKCDSAEPKSIRELQQNGVRAGAAQKGADSVLFGIQKLQQCTIIIDSHCVNARNEFSLYHWKKDKDGNNTHQPAAGYDHLIDAARYAYESDFAQLEGSLIV